MTKTTTHTSCPDCGAKLALRTLVSGRQALEWHDCPALPPITAEESARLMKLAHDFMRRHPNDPGEGG